MVRKIFHFLLFLLKRIKFRSTRAIVLSIVLVQIAISLWIYEEYFNTETVEIGSTEKSDDPKQQKQGNENTKQMESNLASFAQPILNLLPSLLSNSGVSLPDAASLYKKMMFDTSPSWVDDYHLKSHLLTVPMGTEKGKQLESMDQLKFYDSDPRLSWSVYLHYIMQKSNEQSDNFMLPFSWYDWADFHNYNKLISVMDTFGDKFNCQFATKTFFDRDLLEGMEAELKGRLFSIDRTRYDDKFWYRTIQNFDSGIQNQNMSEICIDIKSDSKFDLPFKVSNIWTKLRPEVYQIHARNYILNTLSHPLSMTILDSTNNAYQLPLEQKNRQNMVQSNLLSKFIDDNKKDDDIKFDHLKFFNNFVKDDKVNEKFKISIPNLDKDLYQKDKIELTLNDFKFDIKSKIEELEKLEMDKKLSIHDKHYLDSLRISYQTHPALAPKFLQEVTDLQGSKIGHHRDRRFYNGAQADDGLFKQARLNSLIRTFQKLVVNNGLISWLSHGTLYGHLYDGLTFAYDNDFDLQMPISHLHLLAQYYNQSLVLEDPREGNGRFLLDVTSSISVRTVANGKNNIDARFVDIDSGIYIDITGLSVSSARYKKHKTDITPPDEYGKVKEEVKKMGKNLKTPETGAGLATLSLDDLLKKIKEDVTLFEVDDLLCTQNMIREESRHNYKEANLDHGLTESQRYFLNDKLKLVNCRNSHFSRLDMISPLRISRFHGVPAFVPNKVIESLQNEYRLPKKYGFQSYEGKTFIPKLKQWIIFPVLKRIANVNGAYKNMLPLSSEISALSFPDVKKILTNMVIGKYYNLFSYTSTIFDVTNYRIKEIEIIFDTHLSVEQKTYFLTLLREKVAPEIRSPMKDALLLDYESRIWEILESKFSDDDIASIRESSSLDHVTELSKEYTIFNSHHWFNNILLKVDEDGAAKSDLDKVGLDIFDDIEKKVNTIFEKDPQY